MTTPTPTLIVMEPATAPAPLGQPGRTWPVWILGALVIGSVLALGAVEPWAIFTIEASAAFLCALELWNISRQPKAIVFHPLYAALLWMTLLVIVQLVFATTAYRWITASQLKGLLALEMLFLVAVQQFVDYRRVRLFFFCLTWAGSAICVFALVQRSMGAEKIFWVRSLQYNAEFFGPYVNRNHYAGLMEMLFPLALSLAFVTRQLEKRVLLGFFSFLMAASIFISGSRGGMLACTAQLLVAAVLVAVAYRRRRGWMWGFALVVAALAVTWMLSDRQVAERLLTLKDPLSSQGSGNRLQILRDSIPMVRHDLWLGTGMGTFPVVYPKFRTFYSDEFVNAGHNDYLQLIAETGLLGALALLWFGYVYIRSFRRLIPDWRSNSLFALRMGATLGCLGLLIHSALDFNLHIPANAVLFFLLTAIATGADSTTWLAYEKPNV